MVRMIAAFAVCVAFAVYGQSPAPSRFEVASVKRGNAEQNSTSGIKTAHGRLDAGNVTLQRCIMGAWGVGPHQISGGPDWLETERFEISAKSATGVNDDAVLMVMLQNLLAERFNLVVHRETRIVPAFVLEVAKKGATLEKAGEGEAGTNTSTSNTAISIAAHNTGMDSFAKILYRRTDLVVVDHTGLAGSFKFKLHWSADSARTADGAALEEPSLFTAIEEQLGLHLRPQKAPVEFLVIDHVEKPSEN